MQVKNNNIFILGWSIPLTVKTVAILLDVTTHVIMSFDNVFFFTYNYGNSEMMWTHHNAAFTC